MQMFHANRPEMNFFKGSSAPPMFTPYQAPRPPYMSPPDHFATGGSQRSPSIITQPDGSKAMVVVDPMTRKLTIPYEHVAETKAQLRTSIPSLCQLFLSGRCRQSDQCHQVHANPAIVDQLRLQVEKLPLCCVEHGDEDFTNGHPDRCVHVPNLAWNEGEVPLRYLSRTSGLEQLMLENDGSQGAVKSKKQGMSTTICRLHVMDRCRFAEDCKFLHVCKEIVISDPQFLQFQSSRYASNSVTPNTSFDMSRSLNSPPQTPLYTATAPPFAHVSPFVADLLPGHSTPPSPVSPVSTPMRRYTGTDGSRWSYEPYGFSALLPPAAVEA